MLETAIKDNSLKLLDALQDGFTSLKRQLHKRIVGQDDVIDAVFCCMLAGGHCIVQGVPGLAKTMLVHTLSDALDMTFKRIQFTPDLMPSDITGGEIISEDPQTHRRQYSFCRGPIFSNVVLADEINRTPPKTQAALLEAMQEGKVSAGGRTMPIDKPFFVMATQNPIEQEGTYPLPEAALDRFMFMIFIDYPDADDEKRIVTKTTGFETDAPEKIIDKDKMIEFQEIVLRAPVSDGIVEYCVALARGTRPQSREATEMVNRCVKWGAGPRAGRFLTLGAKAAALIQGRITPDFDDVRAVAKMALRHRIITNFNAEADGVNVELILDDLLQNIQPK